MPGRFVAACLCWLVLALSGCGGRQLCQDQEKIRCCLLDLYTNQIMDNLIRASNGLPIIQVDYSDMVATVTVQANGTLSGSQQVADTTLFTLPAKTLQMTRAITTGLTYGTTGGDVNQLVMHANPVLNNNEVYDAYLQFLGAPGSLMATCDPPPPGAAHLVRCRGKTYCWVPNEPKFKALFLRLALVTTAQRGQPLAAPPPYFENTVTDVVPPIQHDVIHNVDRLTARLAKKNLPSGAGFLEVTLKGKPFRFVVSGYEGEPGKPVAPGDRTDRLVVIYRPADYPEDFKGVAVEQFGTMLKSQPVKIYLHNFQPQVPSTQDLLQGIQNRLEDIRLNQLR